MTFAIAPAYICCVRNNDRNIARQSPLEPAGSRCPTSQRELSAGAARAKLIIPTAVPPLPHPASPALPASRNQRFPILERAPLDTLARDQTTCAIPSGGKERHARNPEATRSTPSEIYCHALKRRRHPSPSELRRRRHNGLSKWPGVIVLGGMY